MTVKKENTKVIVSKDDIDCIVASALEGGINYWCNKVKVFGEYLGEFASDQISRGGCLSLHDYEDHVWYELTPKNFKEGLSLYLQECDSDALVCNEDGKCELDSADIDSIVADRIVQYALFGELVYA